MDIARKGAAANHGVRSISLDNLEFSWQVGGEKILAKSKGSIRDFATHSHHTYRISIDLEEVGRILEALARSGPEIETALLRKTMRHRVPDLLKIANLASSS